MPLNLRRPPNATYIQSLYQIEPITARLRVCGSTVIAIISRQVTSRFVPYTEKDAQRTGLGTRPRRSESRNTIVNILSWSSSVLTGSRIFVSGNWRKRRGRSIYVCMYVCIRIHT